MVSPTRYDWLFIKKLLKIQKKKPERKLPFAALLVKESAESKSFGELHFSQFVFRKDFQRFVEEVKVMLKMSAYTGSFPSVLKGQLKSSIMRTKASVGEKFFSSFESAKLYRESFKKLLQ